MQSGGRASHTRATGSWRGVRALKHVSLAGASLQGQRAGVLERECGNSAITLKDPDQRQPHREEDQEYMPCDSPGS